MERVETSVELEVRVLWTVAIEAIVLWQVWILEDALLDPKVELLLLDLNEANEFFFRLFGIRGIELDGPVLISWVAHAQD